MEFVHLCYIQNQCQPKISATGDSEHAFLALLGAVRSATHMQTFPKWVPFTKLPDFLPFNNCLSFTL